MAKFVVWLLSFMFFCALVAVAGVLFVIFHYEKDLPDYLQLSDYQPAVTTRLYAGNGNLLAEYAAEKRIFVPVSRMPPHILEAFISAEDKHFYSHGGLDYTGIARAVLVNIKNHGKGRRMVGASTITQQVAKNFLLTNEVSFDRKIKEALIAFRMERTFTKEHILELYLNEIYLGKSSYGVAAAALNYFNKSLDELTLGEIAFLAALPKAPNNYDPVKKKAAALERRNWVLERMEEDGYISKEEMQTAQAEDIILAPRDKNKAEGGEYFAEEVRRIVEDKYGKESLYQGGLDIRTSLDPDMQKIASAALEKGLIDFDMSMGWRGPVAHFKTKEEFLAEKHADSAVIVDDIQDLDDNDDNADVATDGGSENDKPENLVKKVIPDKLQKDLAKYELPFIERLKQYPLPRFVPDGWKLALVDSLTDTEAFITLADESKGKIDVKDMLWARVKNDDMSLGPEVSYPSNVLEAGDVVWVQELPPDENKNENQEKTEKEQENNEQDSNVDSEKQPLILSYALRQMPQVNGALIAIDPNTGRILAMSGGISFTQSQFNRATQALRQPGSSFKPFVYLAALDSGYTPSTLILDAPFVLDQGPNKPKWRPGNYSQTYYGPTTLRVGLEKSRNLMTVRLARAVGMRKVSNYAKNFGISDKMPALLSMSLGAGETTLFRLVTAYSMLVNGGKRITPTFIDRIQDRTGKTIYRHHNDVCPDCKDVEWYNDLEVPTVFDSREQVEDARSAYQMVNMLNGVVERGTGIGVKMKGVPLAGKTGTSDNFQDAWFIGFTSDLVVGVFVGYDEPRTMGSKGQGARAAAPIFKEFMKDAVKLITPVPFRVPAGIKLVRVNHKTGLPAKSGDKAVVLEAFKAEDDTGRQGAVIGEEASSVAGEDEDVPNIGGFY